MKHIFVVHSNITYLAALGVMVHDALRDEDCVLISDGYERLRPVKVTRIDYLKGLRQNGWNVWTYLNPCRYTDRAISRLSDGEKFTAYISVTHKLSRVLITHPMCAQFHFMEEGLVSYREGFDLALLTSHNSLEGMRSTGLVSRLRGCKSALRGYTARLGALPIYYFCFQERGRRFYGFSEFSDVLVRFGDRVRLSFGMIARKFTFERRLTLDGDRVWLSDCTDYGDRELYMSAIEGGFVAQLKKEGVERIKLKFHYREGEQSRLSTLALFAKYDIGVDVIADDTIMEVEMLYAKNTKFYGTYSSLLLYGALSGSESYSVDRYYLRGALDQVVPCYWQYVKKL